MKILMIYPRYPDTFWSFRHALKFVSKKAANPPLGLMTISAMLPKNWNRKLLDLNVEKLRKKEIMRADYVFISAMSAQRSSANEIIQLCNDLKTPIVAGGPLFTEDYEGYHSVDHFLLNEAEEVIDQLVHDLNAGIPKRIYQSEGFPSLQFSPAPDYRILKQKRYGSMSIQYSRGCPFDCEFCNITGLFGHKVRTKSTDQFIKELDHLYASGWRRNVFIVDDNFIGNRKHLKNNLLPVIIKWMEINKYPFDFTTEASINLADDPELMSLMSKAGFSNVFIGIESPDENSLTECNKKQNKNRELIESVNKIQGAGLEVSAGFIVGFDSDQPGIFQRQIEFIQESGIISAMVGLLNAPKKTRLYQRLKIEGRLLYEMSGDNTDTTLNFIPKMNKLELLSGYQNILKGIYSAKPYYARVGDFLKRFEPRNNIGLKLRFVDIVALFRSMVHIGIFDSDRKYYWSLFFWSLFRKPKVFSKAITYSIYGYHFRKIFTDSI
ncbi:MAG: B12-binding domain-containing radical SAM protein [Bacteroidales bacterium]|nr:B12-binding domain-containing radical SAM protein [Bacteroidales bacterium]MCF8402419.1 B12-binding domain-containing radical SAM protein [Bacteroidales bacterium]